MKKAITVLLAVLFCLSLCSCNAAEDTDPLFGKKASRSYAKIEYILGGTSYTVEGKQMRALLQSFCGFDFAPCEEPAFQDDDGIFLFGLRTRFTIVRKDGGKIYVTTVGYTEAQLAQGIISASFHDADGTLTETKYYRASNEEHLEFEMREYMILATKE